MVGRAAVQGGREVRFGIPGQADLYGYWRGGSAVEVELKSASGRVGEDQKRWLAWCDRWGVQSLVLQAKADEAAEETVDRWITELAATKPA